MEPNGVLLWGQLKNPFGSLFSKSVQAGAQLQDNRTLSTVIQSHAIIILTLYNRISNSPTFGRGDRGHLEFLQTDTS